MKLLYTVPEACEVLAVGRTKLYELMDSGDLESVHIGPHRRVSAQALEAYAHQLRDSQRVSQ